MLLVEIGDNWVDPRTAVGVVWHRNVLHVACALPAGPVLTAATAYSVATHGSRQQASLALVAALYAAMPEGSKRQVIPLGYPAPPIAAANPAAPET